MPPTRRALLAALAACGLAGCNTGPRDDDPTPARTTVTAPETTRSGPDTTATPEDATAATATDEPTAGGADARTRADAEVDVAVASAFDSYFHRNGADLVSVAGDDAQYLLAEVSVRGTAPPAEEFAVRAGANAYPMTYEPRRSAADPPSPFDPGERYRDGEAGRSGWLAAALPPSLPAAPAVTFRDRSWPVPEDLSRRLTDPASSFSVTGFEAPDRVRPGEPYSVRLTVRNDGGDGTFWAALNWAGERTVTTVELAVPGGGRGRWQATVDVDPRGSTTMALVTPGRTVERTVTVDG
jgi:predicted small lipoprotein YifL